MEYKIAEIEAAFNGQILQKTGDFDYTIKINDKQHTLKILKMDTRGIEFVLDSQVHMVKYLETGTAQMKLVADGTPFTVNMHHTLNEIVYKNSGGGGSGDAQVALHSQIPGKVVSVNVNEGDSIKKGDVVCVLESMKMQVSVKSHKDGTVKKIKVKPAASVAKNDVLAEIE
ncbi:MAG: acetyl-CoA carboxylase biotin carboxyl carrier protein subunit [Nitrosopumilaceae archaeon]|nr:acetyl-CoA carboxylase biotin carboxyl carrier protein subunit [Nitrosopumilaceae archaeon]NDB90186.1 acetyl-CoA carboxylase biotin carboxyl carrier protein subunit [Nitrososphaerota archaeon]